MLKEKEMEKYELSPVDGRKSFYGKCYVEEENGVETLFSYHTKIMSRDKNGNYKRYYSSWTQTTGRHIKAFCGMNKKEFMELEREEN